MNINLLILFLLFGFTYGDHCSDSLGRSNEYRKRHGANPLKCDSQISRDAQAYANKLANGDCELVHSKSEYGENLAIEGGSNKAPDEKTANLNSVKGWYDEVNCYDYNNPGSTSSSCKKTSKCNNCMVGHFTQLVWRKSTLVGVGVAKCRKKKDGFFNTITVANYKVPGNSGGAAQYRENVKKA